MPSASKSETPSAWTTSNLDAFLQRRIMAIILVGPWPWSLLSFPFSFNNRNGPPKAHHKWFPNISKMIGKCLKDGKMMNNWGDITQYCLLHFARKEDAGRPATASYGAGIVAGARKGGVQLPAGTSQSWALGGWVAWFFFGVACHILRKKESWTVEQQSEQPLGKLLERAQQWTWG